MVSISNQNTVNFSLDFELLRSEYSTIKEFLKSGVDTIRNIDFPNEGKLLNAMFSLSQGFERFLKALYAQMHYELNGFYPTNKDFKKFGHNIQILFYEVIKLSKQLNLMNDILVKIENNEEPYNAIITILSDFASMLRYHNLTMLSEANLKTSPCVRWHKEVEEKVIENVKIYYSKVSLQMYAVADANNFSYLYFIDYEGNKIDTLVKHYLLSRQQIAISKYTKMYLCHITVALSEILYKLDKGSFYNEFFLGFRTTDKDLRNKKYID